MTHCPEGGVCSAPLARAARQRQGTPSPPPADLFPAGKSSFSTQVLGAAIVLLAALAAADAVRADPPADAPPLRAVMLWEARTDTTVAPPRRPLSEIDPWIAQDKALHLGAGLLITLSSQYVLTEKLDLRQRQAWPVSLGAAVAAGLTKEIMDSQRPRNPFFSWRDLVATAAGGAVGVVIIVI